MKNLNSPLHTVISELLPPHSWLAVFPRFQGFGIFASVSHFARMHLQIIFFFKAYTKRKKVYIKSKMNSCISRNICVLPRLAYQFSQAQDYFKFYLNIHSQTTLVELKFLIKLI